jgi:hypothetical protein
LLVYYTNVNTSDLTCNYFELFVEID